MKMRDNFLEMSTITFSRGSVVSHIDCFRISKPCFMTQSSGEIGNGNAGHEDAYSTVP